MTRLRMKLKTRRNKPLKERAKEGKNCCRGTRYNFVKTCRVHWKRSSRNKNSKTCKKPHESSSKTKSTEEKINIDPKAPQIATTSSSRLKSLPEKLQNYFTDQDNEYFISQETDNVFVSRKSRKK